LATVVISKIRGHDEVGLGTILGSNIFNSYWIISVASLIYPSAGLPLREVGVALGFAAVTVALTLPGLRRTLGRRRGIVLVLIYAAYVFTILQV
jgi:cation:H+ antiporter